MEPLLIIALAFFCVLASAAFVLSVVSINMHNARMKVQVRVLPHLVDLGFVDGRHGQHTIGIEVTNLSEFPITIKDIMFKGYKFSMVLEPNNFLKGSVPMRLPSKANAVLILTKEVAKKMSDLNTAKVVVRTACKNEVVSKFALRLESEQDEVEVLAGRKQLKKKGWFSWFGKNEIEFEPPPEPEPEPAPEEPEDLDDDLTPEEIEEFEEADLEDDDDEFDIDLSDEFDDEEDEDEDFNVDVDDAVSRRVKGM